MRVINVLLICAGLILSLLEYAVAEPKGPSGEKCDSSETNVKHAINGKQYTCDKCVFTKCDSSGSTISNCQTVTHWSNCVAAAGSSGAGDKATTNGEMAPPTDTSVKKIKPPMVNAPAAKSDQ
jgi:hypothetical protein